MKQVHNASPQTKIKLRRRLVDMLGGPSATRVFETHAGPGVMRRGAFGDVADWLGVDTDSDSPDAIHHDSREVLRAIDLGRFNFFDVDAFGAPWQHVWLISQRRRIAPGELVAMTMTNGAAGQIVARHMYVGRVGWSRQMADALGSPAHASLSHFISAHAAETGQKLVARWFSTARLERWLSARSPNGTTHYFGALLRGT